MVEHRSPKPSVVSSNLTAPANKKAPLAGVFLLAKEGIIRTHEESEFDYKAKADENTPVASAIAAVNEAKRSNLIAPLKEKTA